MVLSIAFTSKAGISRGTLSVVPEEEGLVWAAPSTALSSKERTQRMRVMLASNGETAASLQSDTLDQSNHPFQAWVQLYWKPFRSRSSWLTVVANDYRPTNKAEPPFMSAPTIVEVQGRKLKLTNLEKVLYPAAAFTKGQVVDYYVRIAPVLVPHLTRRALTMKRYPEGVDQEYFFEKNAPMHRPDW